MTLQELVKWDLVSASDSGTRKTVTDFTAGEICQKHGRWVKIEDIKADIIKTCMEHGCAEYHRIKEPQKPPKEWIKRCQRCEALMEWAGITEDDINGI